MIPLFTINMTKNNNNKYINLKYLKNLICFSKKMCL